MWNKFDRILLPKKHFYHEELEIETSYLVSFTYEYPHSGSRTLAGLLDGFFLEHIRWSVTGSSNASFIHSNLKCPPSRPCISVFRKETNFKTVYVENIFFNFYSLPMKIVMITSGWKKVNPPSFNTLFISEIIKWSSSGENFILRNMWEYTASK